MEKKQPLQQMLLENLIIHIQKPETISLCFTLCHYQLKVDQRPYIKLESLKKLKEVTGNTQEYIGITTNS
jgi:hypothetical protein